MPGLDEKADAHDSAFQGTQVTQLRLDSGRDDTPQVPPMTTPVNASPPISPHADSSPASLQTGSSVKGAIFNFTNSVVGAGAIGLGGAFAQSGGIISILAVLGFAYLTKLSLDLVIRLSIAVSSSQQPTLSSHNNHQHCSYEDLGFQSYGWTGEMVVLTAKFLYSFGCCVAYVIVTKDNCGSAIINLLYGTTNDHATQNGTALYDFLQNDSLVTWTLSVWIMLPLCLLRDMTPLSNFSIVSIISMASIVLIIIYLYFDNPDNSVRQKGGTVYQEWFQVRYGFVESLGTFVFSFVSQHTAHLTFGSLKPQLRTLENWKKVSTYSLSMAGTVSLAVGLFVYMTFWEATQSDIFQIYPSTPVIDIAKLLLCTTMVLTFPLPFFTCRELIVVLLGTKVDAQDGQASIHGTQIDSETGPEPSQETPDSNDLETPLLPNTPDETELEREDHVRDLEQEVGPSSPILLPNDDHQLRLPYHVTLTVALWFVTTYLAIAAPSLGDVLDLVGCATGTVIAFVFPALVAFRLEGYSHTALVILVVGGTVGIVGTFYSLKQLITDTR